MKFEHTEVFNFDGALRGMRNPLESWDKKDSYQKSARYHLGENDLKLAQKLIRAGTDHSKFMRQIIVSVDITAPLYWWKELDTYKVGTVANSTSTMHKLASTPVTADMIEDVSEFRELGLEHIIFNVLEDCERLRLLYNKTGDKRYWKALIKLLPESWLQTRTVTMSYQNIRAIGKARKNHKLTEWSVDTMKWIEELPYSKELITFDEETE